MAGGASSTAGDDSRRASLSSLSCSCQHLHQRSCTLLLPVRLLVLCPVRLLVLCECPVLRQRRSNHWCPPLSQLPQNMHFQFLHMMPLGHLHNSLCQMLLTQCRTQDLRWQWCLGPSRSRVPHPCPPQESCLQRIHNNHRHPRHVLDHHLRCPFQPLQL